MDSKKRYIYVLNNDVEDGVTFEAPAVQPKALAVQPKALAVQPKVPAVQLEVVIQPEVATPIATMMERPRRQQRQPYTSSKLRNKS